MSTLVKNLKISIAMQKPRFVSRLFPQVWMPLMIMIQKVVFTIVSLQYVCTSAANWGFPGMKRVKLDANQQVQVHLFSTYKNNQNIEKQCKQFNS